MNSFSHLHFLFIISQLVLLILEFLDLKIPGRFTDSCTTQKIFPLNTVTIDFASKLLSQGSTELDNLSKNAKMFRFEGI